MRIHDTIPSKAVISGLAQRSGISHDNRKIGRDFRGHMAKLYPEGDGLDGVIALNEKLCEKWVLFDEGDGVGSTLEQIICQTDFMYRLLTQGESSANVVCFNDLTYNATRSHYKMVTSVVVLSVGKTFVVFVTYQSGLSTESYIFHFKALFRRHPVLFGFVDDKPSRLKAMLVDHSGAQVNARDSVSRSMV